MEPAPLPWQDAGLSMTNVEVLARKMWHSAIEPGLNQAKARELVIDRLEGKAGRANNVNPVNTELDEQLDRQATDLLNDLAKPSDPPAKES